MDISTRPANLQDANGIAALAAQWRDLLQHSTLTEGQLRKNIESLLGDPDTDFLIATSEDGELLGFVQQRYRYSIWSGRAEAYLEDIFVVEQARGKGVGGRLLELALRRAEARKCAVITLYTNSGNADSIALYERFGFESCTTRFPDSRNYYFSKWL